MGFRLFFLSFLSLLVLCGCATPGSDYASSVYPVLPDLASEAACTERGPSSAGVRCEAIFSKLPVERLREAKKLKGAQASSKFLSVDLQSVRDQRLKNLKLSLDQVLDVLAPDFKHADVAQIALFISAFKPEWNAPIIQAALEKRNSFSARAKNFLWGEENPQKYRNASAFVRRIKALQLPEQKLLLAEYAIQTRAEVLRAAQRDSEIEAVEYVISSLWQYSDGNIILYYFGSNISAQNRLFLMGDLLEIHASLGLNIDGTVVKNLYNNIPENMRLPHLEDALRHQPNKPETKEFLSYVLLSGHKNDILTMAEKTKLAKSNPELWRFLIKSADLDVLSADSFVFRMIESGDVDLALTDLRRSTIKRKFFYKKDQVQMVAPYRRLMAQMTTAAGREKVLLAWAELGPEALALYVGNDAHSIPRLQSLLRLQNNGEAETSIKEYLNSIKLNSPLGRQAFKNPSLRKVLFARAPGLQEVAFQNELKVLRSAELKNEPEFFKALVKNQDVMDGALARALDSVVQANAPPELFLKEARPWTAFLRSIPAADRSSLVLKLLEQNSVRPAILAEFISRLDPIDGVGEAVVNYLEGHNFTQHSEIFSQTELVEMFGGKRLAQFFPHAQGVVLEGPVRAKFGIVLRTSPLSGGLQVNWLRKQMEDGSTLSGIPEAFGFRPVLGYPRLMRQLENDLTGASFAPLNQQVRGLIVQGHYEKAGHSLMVQLNAERGQAQVEAGAPLIRGFLEESLRHGNLSKQPVLMRRLFVKYWSLEADASLIESFRLRALRIADIDSSFWNLRVEIHNFPTAGTLARVKKFRDDPQTIASLKAEVGELVKELEQFLSLSSGAAGLKDIVEKDLVASDVSKGKLNAILAQQEKIGPLADLETTLRIRKEYEAIKSRSTSETKEIERHRGDQILSDAGIAQLNGWVAKLNTVPTAARREGFHLALESLNRDGILSPNEVQSWQQVLQEITADAQLRDLEKKQMLNQALKGIIDQVYFRFVDDFGFYDNSVFKTVRESDKPQPVRFIDEMMRSGAVFALSKAVDIQGLEIAKALKIEHEVGHRPMKGLVDIYNPGEAVGILRFNKNPMELSTSDIAVFDQMPGESAAVAGFITVGVGARLSHLQLLAKSLKIPNIQVSRDFVSELKAYDGKWVRLKAEASGKISIEEASAENRLGARTDKVKLPKASYQVSKPLSFARLFEPNEGQYAGPKGVTLAKLFRSDLKAQTPDGLVLPFGFFNRYVEAIGLKPLLETLGQTKLSNRHLVGVLTSQIAIKIQNNPLPEAMLVEVLSSIEALEKRTGNKLGYFFRSDTNVEDLPNFNGAGLNESVPNVQKNRSSIDNAIRKVWLSPFSEKSIYWRGQALGIKVVTVAEPSVVVMPTIQVKASGVLITKGGPDWQAGRGSLSANFGIGSVVEAGRPVEEYSFESGTPHRISNSVSRTMPVASPEGGLTQKPVEPGALVLTAEQASALNELGQKIESVLGSQPHGWDIEWGVDANNKLIILQARPNM